MGFIDIIIYSIAAWLVGLMVRWRWQDRRRRLDSFRCDVQVIEPDKRASRYLIERK